MPDQPTASKSDIEMNPMPPKKEDDDYNPPSTHHSVHFHQDDHHLSQHAITSLTSSLFKSMIHHDTHYPNQETYTLNLTKQQLSDYHILLYRHMICHNMLMDDETEELLSHGSMVPTEKHNTWGEMNEKRVNWLEHHSEPSITTISHDSEQSAIATTTIEPKLSENKPLPIIAPVVPIVQTLHPFHIKHYMKKYLGQHHPTPPMISWWDQFWAFLGSFLGILLPAFLHFKVLPWANHTDLGLIIGSFGASAVLLYSAIGSDLAQPRNVLGGHLVSAFCGVVVQKIIPSEALFVACALAVALAIVGMNLTKTVHPPGGATALIAVLPAKAIQDLGFLYIVIPVGTGVSLMILIALICNNMPRRRTWPRFWL